MARIRNLAASHVEDDERRLRRVESSTRRPWRGGVLGPDDVLILLPDMADEYTHTLRWQDGQLWIFDIQYLRTGGSIYVGAATDADNQAQGGDVYVTSGPWSGGNVYADRSVYAQEDIRANRDMSAGRNFNSPGLNSSSAQTTISGDLMVSGDFYPSGAPPFSMVWSLVNSGSMSSNQPAPIGGIEALNQAVAALQGSSSSAASTSSAPVSMTVSQASTPDTDAQQAGARQSEPSEGGQSEVAQLRARVADLEGRAATAQARLSHLEQALLEIRQDLVAATAGPDDAPDPGQG